RTALVAGGPFLWVRNPIYSSMLLAALGLALAAPNVLSVLALLALLVALELQVRLVEEPYLTRAHGRSYRDYASRTGRFVPGGGGFVLAPPGGFATPHRTGRRPPPTAGRTLPAPSIRHSTTTRVARSSVASTSSTVTASAATWATGWWTCERGGPASRSRA